MNDSQLTVELGDRSYPVLFRLGAVEELCGRVAALARGHRAILVTDENVAAHHLAPLVAGLAAAGLTVLPQVVPPGEGSKSVERASALYDAALGFGVDRGTPVVALGGGMVGDLAGFVAATLLRGLPLVQVPTSLLAQVDASVGGKTALNHPLGKNLIGAFHQPRLVFSDAAYLATLPVRERRSALAEIVKHALLADAAALAALAEPGVAAGDLGALRREVARAVRFKAAVVAGDERETGARTILNLGHTFGHAYEAEAGFGGLLHGEAVSLGLCVALELSERLSGLPASVTETARATLARLGLPTDWRAHHGPGLMERLAVDKKVRGDRVNLVLLRHLGEPEIVPVRWGDLVESVDALMAQQARESR